MVKKVMLSSAIFLNWLLIHSCNMIHSGDPLPGKIVVSRSVKGEYEYFIYEHSDTPKSSFKLTRDKGAEYSGADWLNTRDTFIGTESIHGLNRIEYRCNIVEFNLSGKIINRIYEAEKGELAWPWYSSRDDKYLLFTTHWQVDPKLYPFEGLTPMLSLVIMDMGQKKVITKIDSIGRDPNFQIKESPWLHDGTRFIYSIGGMPQLRTEEKIINPVEKGSTGVYVYDVSSGEHKLLVPDGSSAIASPTSNQIAYEKDNSIRVLDLNTNEEKIIYKHSPKEKLRGTHWTPDGKYIYFTYTSYSGITDILNSNGEKLIDASTGKEKPFKKIGHGFHSYTWK